MEKIVQGASVVQVADVTDDEAYRLGDPVRRTAAKIGGGLATRIPDQTPGYGWAAGHARRILTGESQVTVLSLRLSRPCCKARERQRAYGDHDGRHSCFHVAPLQAMVGRDGT